MDATLASAAAAHGVGPLVYRTLVDRGEWDSAAPAVRDVLAPIAREAILIDSVRRAHFEQALGALSAAGIEPLVFKGAALAYTHYPEPWLRSRGDTDLLVRPHHAPVVDSILSRLGLGRLPRPRGRRVTQQARYTMLWQSIEVAYDVHWRLSDPQVFADALSYDELRKTAVDGPVPGVRHIGDVHALLVACVHRAAHHYDTDNVLQLYDIYLIARRMTADEWNQFVKLASERQLLTVCRRGLKLAGDLFGSCVPDAVDAALRPTNREASAVFVGGSMTRFDLLRSDLQALRTWRDRIALVYEHVVPSAEYLRQAAPSRTALPFIYVGRLLRGLNTWRHPL